MYQEYAQFIRERYPAITIEGDNYPPPPLRALLAQVLSMTKIAVLLMVVMGQNPFAMLGMATPNIYNWALDNKVRLRRISYSFSDVRVHDALLHIERD